MNGSAPDRRPRGRPRNPRPPSQNPTELTSERALVDVFRQTPWPNLLELVTTFERQRLSSPTDFDLLVKDGCAPQILALLLLLLREKLTLPEPDIWHTIVGSPELREAEARSLEQAAVVLEAVRGRVSTAETATNRAETLWRNLETRGLPTPDRLSADLRLYASLLRFEQVFADATEAQSAAQFFRYALTAYVEKATHRPHHAAVAGLIEDAGSGTYGVTAHRRWRRRNFERIDQHLSRVVDMVVALGNAAKT